MMGHQLALLKNTKGFSLVSVMMAAGMMTVLGLGLATMLKNANDAQAALKARDEAENTKTLATLFLKDPESCKKSLLQSTQSSISMVESPKGLPVQSILSKNGESVIDTASKKSAIEMMRLEPLQKNRQLASVSPSKYYAQLRISFRSPTHFGGGISDRIIPIALERSGNQINGCRLADSSGGEIENPHLDPRNCQGKYTENGRDFVTDSELLNRLLNALPPRICDGGIYPTGGGGLLGRRNDLCSHYRDSFEGKNYTVTPTLIEGTRTAHTTMGRDTGTCQDVTTYSICINGRLVPSDTTSRSTSERGDCR